MSKIYLHKLSQEEYHDLSKQLYEKQSGKCYVCGKSLPISPEETSILSLTNRRIFKIEDYALCHKKCNVEGIRDSIFWQAVDNFEFVEEVSMELDFDDQQEKSLDEKEDICKNIDEDDEFNDKNVSTLHHLYNYYWETLGRDFEKDIKKRIKRLEHIVKLNSGLKRNFGCQQAYKTLIEHYRECNDKINEERIIKLAVEQFSTPLFARMLCEFNKVEYNTHAFNTNDLYNYGEKFERHLKEHLPEFNFYQNYSNPFKKYNFEKLDMLPTIRVIEKHFGDLSGLACSEISEKRYENAIEIYEQLIAEGDKSYQVFDALIRIYTIINKKDSVIMTLQRAIKCYEEQKLKEIEYVRFLAKKYSAEDYCEMCIRIEKEIRYYCGYIVLYQKHTCIDRWKKELKKLLK